MVVFIVDLHVHHAWNLLKRVNQGLGDAVRASIRLAVALQIHAQHPVHQLRPPVARKSVVYADQPLRFLLGVWSSEVLRQCTIDWTGRSGDLTCHRLIERRRATCAWLRVGEEDAEPSPVAASG